MSRHARERVIAWLALIVVLALPYGRPVAQSGASPSGPVHIGLPAHEAIDLDRQVAPGSMPIAEPHRFHGLARYLNGLRYFRVAPDGIRQLQEGESVTLAAGEWFAAVGRFHVLALQDEGIRIRVGARRIQLAAPSDAAELSAVVASKPQLHLLDPALDKLRYAHLWGPLAALSKLVESMIVFIERTVGAGWAVALVLFAVLVKLALLPVSLATASFQRQASAHRAALAPVLESIKREYRGEEAHNRIMAAHKARGITPFYTLKPTLGLFVLLPVLIAIFNALAEMPQFAGAGFLWIEDLAYPDDIFPLPATLPFLGDTFNLLPWLMALVSVAASLRFRDPHASPAALRRRRQGLLLMAAAFLVLFYPFPAAMVLYWLLNNLLQMVQQEIRP